MAVSSCHCTKSNPNDSSRDCVSGGRIRVTTTFGDIHSQSGHREKKRRSKRHEHTYTTYEQVRFEWLLGKAPKSPAAKTLGGALAICVCPLDQPKVRIMLTKQLTRLQVLPSYLFEMKRRPETYRLHR